MNCQTTGAIRRALRAHRLPRRALAAPFLLILALFSPMRLSAQVGDGWEILQLEVTRARLQALLDDVDRELGTGALSDERRIRLSYRSTVIRKRLAEGDFRSGDHIVLEVDGTAELTDTFTVGSGAILRLPLVEDIDLFGILRSELETYLTERIAKIMLAPRVRARSLVQLSILGEVMRPGFYLATPDARLTEALMSAGGPTQNANFAQLKIERGPASPWTPEGRPSGPIESYSVDELGLRTGDRIIVPAKKSRIAKRDFIQIGLLVLTSAATIISLLRR